MRTLIAILAASLALPAYAGVELWYKNVLCRDATTVHRTMARLKMAPTWAGMSANIVYTLYEGEGGSWALIAGRPDGPQCLLDEGNGRSKNGQEKPS